MLSSEIIAVVRGYTAVMATLAKWDQHGVADFLRDILRTAPRDVRYRSGRAFLTAYQLSIELSNRHPQVAQAITPRTGGQGQGPYALTTYIAKQLSARIRRGVVTDMEISFLGSLHLTRLDFSGGLRATTTQQNHASILFRLIR